MPAYLFIHSSPMDRMPPGGLERFLLDFPGTPEEAEMYVKDYRIGAPVEFKLWRRPKNESNQQPMILCQQFRQPSEDEAAASNEDGGLSGVSDNDVDAFLGGEL